MPRCTHIDVCHICYTGIVRVQCYQGRNIEMVYVNTVLENFGKPKYAILTRHNTSLGHIEFAMLFQRMESLFG